MPATCNVCFRHCELSGNQLGFCRARKCLDRRVVSDAYGKVTALQLDPIEKKPLARFQPGSMILSVGSYGCNLRCPFCQNHEIAQAGDDDIGSQFYSPDQLVALAEKLQPKGNIGIAFTYNEPLINYEFVRDTFKACKAKGLKTVLVSNGTAEPEVLQQVLPLTDAVNFDLKAFRKETYRDVLKGDLETVQYAIMMAADWYSGSPLCKTGGATASHSMSPGSSRAGNTRTARPRTRRSSTASRTSPASTCNMYTSATADRKRPELSLRSFFLNVDAPAALFYFASQEQFGAAAGLHRV